jgi:hypothetical protein
MEELMSFAMKMLLGAAVITTAVGAASFSPHPRQQPATPLAENTAHPSTVAGPSKDDPLQAGPSWTRWHTLTDF